MMTNERQQSNGGVRLEKGKVSSSFLLLFLRHLLLLILVHLILDCWKGLGVISLYFCYCYIFAMLMSQLS